ncbi:biotin/lipoyl-binding protein (plasmid) [Bradyrhizobium sp. CB82]|uniref:HlyD family secretion protein n=1 Tax=Bradyrhizobium sp. CB82 TaxID=3039159 RepID=UPI0024B089EC|nr:biotin/lipoyl-binding protein [Bradyrhizobium sp. CB82]WFU45440.1 biotin/lipoyl-binding protein [Bradyrhizobium sp. CB82]
MRFAVAALFCGSIVGLGYTYSHSHETSVPTFLTAPVERGSIATLVTASGTLEAVVSVDVSSQLSGRIAQVFVSFNDAVTAGQPIAQIDPEIFAARVNEAKAVLKVAKATAEVQKAALERAKVAVANAQTAEKLAEEQSTANKARQDEVEREFLRKVVLARTGAGTERDLTQARALRDVGAADLRASLDQIQMKTEAIAIAEAERLMAEANLENAQAVVEQKQAALDQAQLDLDRTVLRAPIDGIIINRDVNPGQTVAVSLEAKTLFKIANDLREMEVHGKIDEADTGEVLKIPGQALRFQPADAGSRSARRSQTEAASPKALATVWAVGDDGQPSPIAVKLGATDDNGAELLEGQLAEGRQLIIGVASTQTPKRYFGVRLGF